MQNLTNLDAIFLILITLTWILLFSTNEKSSELAQFVKLVGSGLVGGLWFKLVTQIRKKHLKV
jgi:hypothetical protein